MSFCCHQQIVGGAAFRRTGHGAYNEARGSPFTAESCADALPREGGDNEANGVGISQPDIFKGDSTRRRHSRSGASKSNVAAARKSDVFTPAPDAFLERAHRNPDVHAQRLDAWRGLALGYAAYELVRSNRR